MPNRSYYKPNPRFAIEWPRTPDAMRLLAITSGVVAARAQQLAQAEAFDTGDYADGIKVSVVEASGKGRVNAFDFKSHWIEFGTVSRPAHHILTRAAESIGLHVLGRAGSGIFIR